RSNVKTTAFSRGKPKYLQLQILTGNISRVAIVGCQGCAWREICPCRPQPPRSIQLQRSNLCQLSARSGASDPARGAERNYAINPKWVSIDTGLGLDRLPAPL